MPNFKIAVIGKSSAGKSAFIKSFSSTPEYINSVGRGQTTRAYAEYRFLRKYDDDFPSVVAEISTQTAFSDNRAAQVNDKFSEINDYNAWGIDWIKSQFEDEIYEKRIKNIMLYSDDFFNIREFVFLDDGIVEKAEIQFEQFKLEISQQSDKSSDEEQNIKEEKGIRTTDCLTKFYKNIFDLIFKAVDDEYGENPIFVKENGISYFKFSVNDETKEIFSWLLKVDEGTMNSLTGIVSKVRVNCGLNEKYKECLSGLNIRSISFIDTYGLDHSESIDKKVLVERYNKIFNKDYPEISTVFLVEALHAGASNEFKKAITTLYEIKPEIMTYIVGTYIDENEQELLYKTDWLYSEDKTIHDAPRLNGKVQHILEENTNLLATLLDQGISASMAKKRCEVMQKRFAPFCGKLGRRTAVIDYEKANLVSVKALFSSIADKEHLGDGYIQIDKVKQGIYDTAMLDIFSAHFIENVKLRFKQIYELSASRTRWKIRENLEQYILGFDGTTLDATWKRAFRDAYNLTFTKQIKINGNKVMLSDVLKMEGNSKIAFDEVMATIYSYFLKRRCKREGEMAHYVSEIDCRECAERHSIYKDCIWNSFITAASYEAFKGRNRFVKVIDWLEDLHEFSNKDISDMNREISNQLKTVMQERLLPLCREHNMHVASKKVARSESVYADVKSEIYESYREEFDQDIDKTYFDSAVNMLLAERR